MIIKEGLYIASQLPKSDWHNIFQSELITEISTQFACYFFPMLSVITFIF